MFVSTRGSGPVRSSLGFLAALGAFVRSPIGPDECRRLLTSSLTQRETSLLRVFRRLAAGDPATPYRRLLDHAGIRLGDVESLVRRGGVEDALGRLHAAGVYVTLDEFKGRRPIRRGSLTFDVTAADFDNRALTASFVARTGGSRSRGRKLLIDLDLIAHEACYEWQTATSFGQVEAVRALWKPVPPGTSGLKVALRWAKIGRPISRWFTQNPPWNWREWQHTLFNVGSMVASRWASRALPWPAHVPPAEALTVARWLAYQRRAGRRAALETNVSSAVRVCQAAETAGLDIAGAVFYGGGEPYTEGKEAVVSRAGCRVAVNYAMSESGRIAVPCADPRAPDDAHVVTDKVVLLQREAAVTSGTVPGLFLTGIHPSTPKVMINVEVGDYATVETRPCGCRWNDLGFTQHLHGIRSYEKLTAEGMHFVGGVLVTLIEQVMPATFGGTLLDYQLVEHERNGLPVVSLVISPRLGEIDADRARDRVLQELGRGDAASRMMAMRWRDTGTLQIERREPYTTSAGKVLALHVPQGTRHEA